MANLVITRLSSGAALSRTFGRQVFLRTTQSTTVVSDREISTTSVLRERLYGPLPVEEQKDDLSHWANHRYVAGALIPIIPLALAYPNPVLDTALTAGILLHTHWGFSGVAKDYIHGPVLYPIAKYTVLVFSIAAFGTMCYFNYYDVGFAAAARLIFSQL